MASTTRLLCAVVLMMATACETGRVVEGGPSPTPPSPSAPINLEEFNVQWCVPGRAILRVFSDGTPFQGEEEKRQTLEEAADRLDALTANLDRAGFHDVAEEVDVLSQGVRDVSDGIAKPDLLDSARAIARGTTKVNRALDPVVESLGTC